MNGLVTYYEVDVIRIKTKEVLPHAEAVYGVPTRKDTLLQLRIADEPDLLKITTAALSCKASLVNNKYRQDLLHQLHTPGKFDWNFFIETAKKAQIEEEDSTI